jgi:hypothetical protein
MIERSSKLDRILMNCIHAIEGKGWTIEDCLRRYPHLREDLKPMLEAAIRLRNVRSLQPSLRFKREAISRMQLRLQASRRPPKAAPFQRRALSEGIPPKARIQAKRQPALQWALPILVVAFTLIAMAGGFTFVADAAMPGDVLYSIDRALEKAQILLEPSAEGRTKLYLRFASERLEEASKLLEAGKTNEVIVALQGYEEDISAAETILLENVAGKEEPPSFAIAANQTLQNQTEQLRDLSTAAPLEAQDSIKVALSKVSDIQTAIATATSSPKETPLPQEDETPISPEPTLIPRPSATAPLKKTPIADGTPAASATPLPPTAASATAMATPTITASRTSAPTYPPPTTQPPTATSIPLPDLTIESINWPATASEGILLNLSYRVNNIGTAAIGDGFIDQLIVDDEPLANVDKQVGFQYGIRLQPGGSDTYGFVWRTTCGLHELFAITDSSHLFNESNENNNSTAHHRITIDCGTPPQEE